MQLSLTAPSQLLLQNYRKIRRLHCKLEKVMAVMANMYLIKIRTLKYVDTRKKRRYNTSRNIKITVFHKQS